MKNLWIPLLTGYWVAVSYFLTKSTLSYAQDIATGLLLTGCAGLIIFAFYRKKTDAKLMNEHEKSMESPLAATVLLGSFGTVLFRRRPAGTKGNYPAQKPQ